MNIDTVTYFLGRFFLYGLAPTGLLLYFCRHVVIKWIDKQFAQRQKEFEHE